jgi:antirestriction protein ArdC
MHKETQKADIPKWSALLVDAVTRPGLIMEAYNAFWSYSVGNQILALTQLQLRSIAPGPINTYPGWQALGRNVKRGERALTLCMPITRKRRDEPENNNDETSNEHSYTSFRYKAAWFCISQTIGEEFTPPRLPEWDAQRALLNLNIQLINFEATDGNIQGYARLRQVAINPVAQLKIKTLLHETAHVILDHTLEGNVSDGERTPRNLREVEAEAVALLCCEALNLEGADFCRGYLQHWLKQGSGYNAEAIPEKSAQKIFRAADQILRAGRAPDEIESNDEDN